MSAPLSGRVMFGGFKIDRARWQLRHGEHTLPLNRKTFDLLLYLVDHRERVVTKDELLRELWPGSFIEESNLTQQIFLLRKALSRHEPDIKFVETVPGRGYRFAVPVHTEAVASPLTRVDAEGQALNEGGVTMRQNGDAAHAPAHDSRAAESAVATSGERLSNPARWTKWPKAGWVMGGVVLASLLLAFALFPRSSVRGRPFISAYAQITHDGHAKSLGGTDGTRMYFTRLEKSSLAEMPISGGAEALLSVGVRNPWAGQVSPDGSTLLIISQAGGQGPAASLWALELVGGNLHRLGNAIAAAWSPDGKQIVYSSAGGELFAMQRDGSEGHRIATVGGYVSLISWSPDGQMIRFSRDGLLWQVAPDGSHLGQLLPTWSRSATQTSGGYARDGRYFFVADGQIWMLDERRGLFRSDAPAPVQLTYGPTAWDRPMPTPDGQRILASGRTTRGELVRFDPVSGQSKAFLSGISAEFLSFSQAAKALAYVSFPEGVLWRANLDGSHPVPLTQAPAYPKSICWALDGSQIAYVDRTVGNVPSVFLISADGSGKPRRLLPDDREAENDPSWSPDGRQIAFSTSPNVGASSKSDLRVAEIATGKTTVIPGSEGLLVPRWSPDGRSLAAMTLDAQSLRVLDVATGRWSFLDTGAVAFPEWSHDGRYIYYVRWTSDAAILRIRIADGRQEVLAKLTDARYTGVYTLWMGLDPEDNPLMLRDAGSDDIYALTLEGN